MCATPLFPMHNGWRYALGARMGRTGRPGPSRKRLRRRKLPARSGRISSVQYTLKTVAIATCEAGLCWLASRNAWRLSYKRYRNPTYGYSVLLLNLCQHDHCKVICGAKDQHNIYSFTISDIIQDCGGSSEHTCFTRLPV